MKNSAKVALAVSAALSAGSLVSAGTIVTYREMYAPGEANNTGKVQADFVDFSGRLDGSFVGDDDSSTIGYASSLAQLGVGGLSSNNFPFSLFAMKDLFDKLPGTLGNGDTLQINSATLRLVGGASGVTTNAYRMTTDWVSAANRVGRSNPLWGSTPTPWITGDTYPDEANRFNATNYTTVNGASDVRHAITLDGNAGGDNGIDLNITQILQDSYAAGQNYGIVLLSSAAANNFRSSNSAEWSGSTPRDAWWFDPRRPTLTIDYQYNPVPEPASLGLLAIGAAGFLARRRRSH